MQRKLIITLENGETHEHILNGEKITLGRSDDNTIIVKDGSISSHHAEFIEENGNYKITDLGSTNGSSVEGVPAKDTLLEHGAQITLGYVMASYNTSEGIKKEKEDEIKEEQKAQELKKTQKISLTLPEEPTNTKAEIAKMSAKPIDFETMSPFKNKSNNKDSISYSLFTLSGISLAVTIALLVTIILKM